MSVSRKHSAEDDGGPPQPAEKRARTSDGDSSSVITTEQDERHFDFFKLVDEDERVNDEREISTGSYTQATLKFVNMDVNTARAVVVFADCQGKLLPAYFERGLTNDFKQIRPGEILTVVGFKAEPRSNIYFKYLDGRVQLQLFKDTEISLHKNSSKSSEELLPTNVKDIRTGANKSIFFACLTEKGGKQTKDNASYSFEILHFIDSVGQKFEVFIGDRLLDKGAEMKPNEVYHLYGLSIERSTIASKLFKITAMTYLFRFTPVDYSKWTAICDESAAKAVAAAATARLVTLSELKKDPKLGEASIKVKGVVTTTPFKDHFDFVDGSEDADGGLLKISVASKACRVLKFDSVEITGQLNQANVLQSSSDVKKKGPTEEDKFVVEKIKNGHLQIPLN